MAIGTTTVSAAELANMAADKPLVCGKNLVRLARVAGTTMKWCNDATPTTSSTDRSATDGPASMLGDDSSTWQSYTNTTSTTWWAVIDFGATYDVDFIAILNYNFPGVALRLDLDDASTFATAVTAVAAGTVSASPSLRYSILSLGAGNARYTGVRYARVRFQTGGAAFTAKLGEIWLGKRIQLAHQPNEPWSAAAESGLVDMFESKSGARTNYVRHAGRRIFAPEFIEHDATALAALRTFKQDCSFGALPFLWCDKPTSDPQRFMMMHQSNPGMPERTEGPVASRFSFNGCEEIGPPFEATE